PAPTASPARGIADAEEWLALVASCALKGPSRQLADNAAFVGYAAPVLKLSLAPGFEYLRSERSLGDLVAALAPALGGEPKIVFETGEAAGETLQERNHRQRDARQAAAEEDFMNHPEVQRLIQQHGAKVVPDSIRPLED
ncbi:MAG TPA: DNA polymerase III subunit gamma/tau C-terminal domain-containing protein, partial [Pseudoxanthomonas sp.]|nr:DNA polymerase III subunit gamma/tau C-terminal domain-containing protein [Pseudoxanthomonas sp.]